MREDLRHFVGRIGWNVAVSSAVLATVGCAAFRPPGAGPETYTPGLAVQTAGESMAPPAVPPSRGVPPGSTYHAPANPGDSASTCPIFDLFDAKQRLRRALEPLMLGDEKQGRRELILAVCQTPEDEHARDLLRQLDAAPEKFFGGEFFAYRVREGDSLPGIARRFLGDPYRFYALARYNDLEKPGELTVGRCLRIPGRPPGSDVGAAEALARCGADLEEAGNVHLAHDYFSRGVELAPDGAANRAGVRRTASAAVASYRRRAVSALGSQDLPAALWNCTKALEIEPGNEDVRELYETADELSHHLAAVLYREAEAAYARSDRAEVVATCGRVLELDPDHEGAGELLRHAAGAAADPL